MNIKKISTIEECEATHKRRKKQNTTPTVMPGWLQQCHERAHC